MELTKKMHKETETYKEKIKTKSSQLNKKKRKKEEKHNKRNKEK